MHTSGWGWALPTLSQGQDHTKAVPSCLSLSTIIQALWHFGTTKDGFFHFQALAAPCWGLFVSLLLFLLQKAIPITLLSPPCSESHCRKEQSHSVSLNPTTVTSLLSLNQYFNGPNFPAFDQNAFRAAHLQILPLAFQNKQKEQDNLCEASLPTIYSWIYATSF